MVASSASASRLSLPPCRRAREMLASMTSRPCPMQRGMNSVAVAQQDCRGDPVVELPPSLRVSMRTHGGARLRSRLLLQWTMQLRPAQLPALQLASLLAAAPTGLLSPPPLLLPAPTRTEPPLVPLPEPRPQQPKLSRARQPLHVPLPRLGPLPRPRLGPLLRPLLERRPVPLLPLAPTERQEPPPLIRPEPSGTEPPPLSVPEPRSQPPPAPEPEPRPQSPKLGPGPAPLRPPLPSLQPRPLQLPPPLPLLWPALLPPPETAPRPLAAGALLPPPQHARTRPTLEHVPLLFVERLQHAQLPLAPAPRAAH